MRGRPADRYSSRIRSDEAVVHEQLSLRNLRRRSIIDDGVLRKIVNVAVVNIYGFGRENINAVSTERGPSSINVEVPEYDYIIGSCLEDDTLNSRGKNSGDLSLATINGDRFRDGHRPEATWIQDVDFAGGSSLRLRARKGFAGCRAAAWIDIVADAGDPRARCLRLR